MGIDLYSLKQRSALSGEPISGSVLNRIVQSELESEYNNLPQRRQYELMKQAQEERNREYELNKEQMEKARLAKMAGGLGQTAMQLGTSYGLSDSHVLKDAAGKVVEYFNPTNSSMSATGITPGVGNTLQGATPLYQAPTVGETAGLVNPVIQQAPTATQILGATESGLGSVPQIAADSSLLEAAPTMTAVQEGLGYTPIVADTTLGATGLGATGLGTASEAIPTVLPLAETGTMGATAAGAATAAETGAGIGIGGIVGAAAPYAAVANFVDRAFVRPLIGDNKTLKIIEDIFNPLGGLTDLVEGDCIIVTACTNRDSKEVDITREYRDRFLSHSQLSGYYRLAEKVVPVLKRNDKARNKCKKWLVDRLIDYGSCRLGHKDKCRISSYIVSKLFLATISIIGLLEPDYKRANGEAY